MAENDIYIAGLGPGVPEWSNEITQQQILDALRSGFGGTDSSNQQIVAALGKISTGDKSAESTLKELLGSNEKVATAVQQNTANDKTSEMKTMSIFSSMKDLLISGNKIAREQTEQLKRDKAFERNVKQKMSKEGGGKSEAEARMEASFDSASQSFSDAKDNIIPVFKLLATAVTGSKALNAMVREGTNQRFDMAQEIRQSGLMAGMDTAAAGLINLSKTISGANFTFGEAQQFTQQFAQAVGVRGVEASLLFSNQLADMGEGNGDMMRKFGMEFSEVAEIAGTYMESLRTIGQLDKLSDTQMRSGMDDFMDNVVSTSNTMNVNLQDAANMIKDTLKQDKFASMLALLEPEMRETVTAMVGKFGGDGTLLGEGIGTALAAGSTEEFLMTEIGQRLQGDVFGQQLIPLITKIADEGRNGGTDAAMAAYASIGPQLREVIESGKDSKGFTLLNIGDARQIIAEAAGIEQNIVKADYGTTGLAAEDRTAITGAEIFRQQIIAGESVQNVLIESANVSENLNKLNEVLFTKTKELRKLGTGMAEKFGGTLIDITTDTEEAFESLKVLGVQFGNLFVGSEGAITANTTALDNLSKALGADIKESENIKEAKSLRSDSIQELEDAKLNLAKNESGQTTGFAGFFTSAEDQAVARREEIAKLEAAINGYTAIINGKTVSADPATEQTAKDAEANVAAARAEKSAKLSEKLLERVQNIEDNNAKIASLEADIEASKTGTKVFGDTNAAETRGRRDAENKIDALNGMNKATLSEINKKQEKLTSDDSAKLTEALSLLGQDIPFEQFQTEIARLMQNIAKADDSRIGPDTEDKIPVTSQAASATAGETVGDSEESDSKLLAQIDKILNTTYNSDQEAHAAAKQLGTDYSVSGGLGDVRIKATKSVKMTAAEADAQTPQKKQINPDNVKSVDINSVEEVLAEIRKDNNKQIQDNVATQIAAFDSSRHSSIEKLLKNTDSSDSNRAENLETLKNIKSDGDLEVFSKLLKALEASKEKDNTKTDASPMLNLTAEEKVYNNDITKLVTELRGLVKALN